MSKEVSKSQEGSEEGDSTEHSDEADKETTHAEYQLRGEGQEVDFFILPDLHVGCRTGSE